MKNGLFTINWTNVKSSLVNCGCAMVLWFMVSMVNSILSHHSIFGLDWKSIIDASAMEALGVFAMMLSLVRNFFTTDDGKFLNAVQVIPETK